MVMENAIDVVEFEFPREKADEFRMELQKILVEAHVSLSFIARYRFDGDNAVAEVPLSAVSKFSNEQVQRLKNISTKGQAG